MTHAATASQPKVTQTKLPSHAPPPAAISNRYNKLLESPVTYTKQTPRPISNRYKMRLFVSLPRSIFATAQSSLATSHERGQTKGASDSPVSRAISNRYNKLLELPVTYTKHTAHPNSNRYKQPLFATPRNAFWMVFPAPHFLHLARVRRTARCCASVAKESGKK